MCRLQGYVTADVADAEGLHRLNLSGTKFRQLLRCVQIYLCNGGVCLWPADSEVCAIGA